QFSGLVDFAGTTQDHFDIQSEFYTQTGNSFEILSVASGKDSVVLTSCNEYTKLDAKYKGSTNWSEINSSSRHYFDPVSQELVSRVGEKVLDQYRLRIFLQCTIPSWVTDNGLITASGTYRANVYNGNPVSSGVDFYKIASISGTTLDTKKMLSGAGMLMKTIIVDAQSLEGKMKIRSSDQTMQFTVLTDLDITFLVDVLGVKRNEYKLNSDVNSMVVSTRMTSKLTDATPAPTPTTANSRDEVLEITKIYQSTTGNSLLTSPLDTTPLSGRQIAVEVRMAKYISDPSEGTPIVTIKKPNGVTFGKYNTAFLSTSGDDRTFIVRVTIPQDSEVGAWTVTAENVNRSMKSNKTFNVSNSATSTPTPSPTPSPTDTPESLCTASGGLWNPITSTCGASTSSSEIGIAKMGFIWKLYDTSGNILNNGDTRTDDSLFGLGNLQKQSLVLEPLSLAETRAGTFLNWDYYEITAFMTLEKDSGIADLDTLADLRVGSPSGICAELSVVGKTSTGTTNPKCILPSTVIQTPSTDIIPLGDFRISRSDVDTLGRNAQLPVGEDFRVHADIKGSFKLVNIKTNVEYKGMADGSSWEQKFKFGSILEKTPQQICNERGSDYVWNASSQTCDQKGGVDKTPKELCEERGSDYVWTTTQNGGEICKDTSITDTDKCIEPKVWIDNACTIPIDTLKQQCEAKAEHEWKNNKCVLIIIQGKNTPQEICEATKDHEWKNGECVLIDDVTSKEGPTAFCNASLSSCFDEALQKILDNIEHDRVVRDQMIMIVVALVVVIGIITAIKFKQRQSY
ncbi:MAG: hypothetical protein OPY03_02995, partial [Nitrosopumilus sp.]|nr:hypothetical protein [Nitrosopumilus sp.]